MVYLKGKKNYKIHFQPVKLIIYHVPFYYFDPKEVVIIIQLSLDIILIERITSIYNYLKTRLDLYDVML